MITEKEFKKAFNEDMTYPDMAQKFDVSEGTIKNYARILKLSRGKGNRTNHNTKRDF